MIEKTIKKLIELKKTISTMESCSGGALANAITNIPDASKIFSFGAVTYSNEYKIKMGVDKNIIDTYSVYSMQTANEMSKKISMFTSSDFGVGITGKLKKKDSNNLYGDDNEKPFVVKLTFDNEKQIKEFNQKYSEQLRNEFNCSISLSGGGL